MALREVSILMILTINLLRLRFTWVQKAMGTLLTTVGGWSTLLTTF